MKNWNICFYHLREEKKTLKPEFLIKDINKYNEFKHHIDAFRVRFFPLSGAFCKSCHHFTPQLSSVRVLEVSNLKHRAMA